MKKILIALSLMSIVVVSGCKKDKTEEDIFKGHGYVDLGLPSGTHWATCNIGADKPEEYGDMFAWGEIVGYNGGKKDFSVENYKWCKGTFHSMTKYCTISEDGTVDNKLSLELDDDAAHVIWGGKWHMPTRDQANELVSNCVISYATVNGAGGVIATSKINGRSIFLPAGGIIHNTELNSVDSTCCYWTNSLMHGSCYDALSFLYDISEGLEWFGSTRPSGLSIRPVINE